MNLEFESKTFEYDACREKIVSNHEFLSRWYVEMQRKLNEKND